MGLTVVGPQPLPELRAWVEEKFAAVPDRNARPYVPGKDELLYKPEQLPLEVDVKPLKKLHKLTLGFPIPSQRRYWMTRPVNYVAHFIGDEGQGSLYNLLREKGWITSLSAGGHSLDDMQGVFNVTMELTDEGMNHVPEITEHLFQYIDLLASRGVEKWRFDELKKKSELDFRFEEKTPASTYAMILSSKLLRYPPAEVVRGGKVLLEWKPELMGELLGYLRPDNLTITLVDPKVKTDKIEAYYQVPYRVASLDSDLLARWSETGVDEQLTLPEPNPFMPDRVALKPVEQPMEAPVALAREPGDMLWYQQDRDFGVPKAVFNIKLEMPHARSTATEAVSLSLLADLVEDELNAWSYPAQLAGLQYRFSANREGLLIWVMGYDDKLPLLLQKVLAGLKKPRLQEDRFNLYKAKYHRELENQALERPFRQILSERSRRLLKPSWTPEQKLAALEALTVEQLRDYARHLFDDVEVQVLAYGNLTADEAMAMEKILKTELLSGSRLEEVPEPRLTIIPRGETLTYRYDVDHPDSAVVISYQGNEKSIGEQARWRLLGHIMASPFFNELRTEQQLGYVVAAAFSETENMPGMLFLVQSSAVSAAELRKRMEAFVKAWADELQAMSEEEFAAHKAGLVSKLLKKDDMMLQRAVRYMSNMEREHYSFDFNARMAEKVKALDKADLLAFYRENLLEQPRRLVVYSPGTRFPEE